MAFSTLLCYNISTNQLIKSATNPIVSSATWWYYLDTKHLNVQFVTDVSPGIVSVVPATGIGLQVAIGQPGGTVYSSATAPPAVSDVFTVDLPMNTAALTTAIAGGPVQCKFEFRTSDGTNAQRYEFDLLIKPSLISDTLSPTPVPDVGIGVNAANATYVRKLGRPGDFQILVSQDGTKKARLYLGNDNKLKCDPM